MFTEGLDETAIEWIKNGSDAKAENQRQQASPRSPLAEKFGPDQFPKSPLPLSGNSSFSASHGLPPLKFHSGLLSPHGLMVLNSVDDEEEIDNDEESVVSVSDSTYSYEDVLGSIDSKPTVPYLEDDEIFGHRSSSSAVGHKGRYGSSLNRGLLHESLRVEVPENFRTLTGGELGIRKNVQKSSTPCGSSEIQKRIHLSNVHVGIVRI